MCKKPEKNRPAQGEETAGHRESNGRFLPGSPAGPGRPSRKALQRLADELEDIRLYLKATAETHESGACDDEEFADCLAIAHERLDAAGNALGIPPGGEDADG